jgi:hypothetical protein
VLFLAIAHHPTTPNPTKEFAVAPRLEPMLELALGAMLVPKLKLVLAVARAAHALRCTTACPAGGGVLAQFGP